MAATRSPLTDAPPCWISRRHLALALAQLGLHEQVDHVDARLEAFPADLHGGHVFRPRLRAAEYAPGPALCLDRRFLTVGNLRRLEGQDRLGVADLLALEGAEFPNLLHGQEGKNGPGGLPRPGPSTLIQNW